MPNTGEASDEMCASIALEISGMYTLKARQTTTTSNSRWTQHCNDTKKYDVDMYERVRTMFWAIFDRTTMKISLKRRKKFMRAKFTKFYSGRESAI